MTDYNDLYKRLWQAVLATEGKLDGDAKTFMDRFIKQLQDDGYKLSSKAKTQLNAHFMAVESSLKSGISQAIAIASVKPADVKKAMASKEVLQATEAAFVRQWQDGKNLSDRLWNFQTEMTRGIEQTLKEGARTGKSINKLVYDMQYSLERNGAAKFAETYATHADDWAMRLYDQGRLLIKTADGAVDWKKAVELQRGLIESLEVNGTKRAAERALSQMELAVNKGSEALLSSSLRWWGYDKQLYFLKRIARTEMSTAAHNGVIDATVHDKLILGYQWRLSSSHPSPDICDYYASVEMGLGKGVYTREAVPRSKAHPHCMCLLIPRVTKIKEKGSADYGRFIQTLPAEARDKLLPKWARDAHALGTPLNQLVKADNLGLITKAEAKAQGFISTDAFENAKVGGKHSEWYKRQLMLSDAELNKSIKSFEKLIAKHQDWINNPTLKNPDFYQLDVRRQDNLLNHHWKRYIERHREFIDIVKGVLREKANGNNR